MLESFESFEVTRDGVRLRGRRGGRGNPLLLLHGHPQSHAMWHRVAPQLAEDFTVVMMDLRGYGDSARPEAGEGGRAYSKREMALDAQAVAALVFGQGPGRERAPRKRFAAITARAPESILNTIVPTRGPAAGSGSRCMCCEESAASWVPASTCWRSGANARRRSAATHSLAATTSRKRRRRLCWTTHSSFLGVDHEYPQDRRHRR